jgi:hypothetical protein
MTDEAPRDYAQEWKDFQEQRFLLPLIDGINAVLASPQRQLSIVWREDAPNKNAPGAWNRHLVILQNAAGKSLTVYMTPDTMRKRLEIVARILDVKVPK